MIYFVGLFGTTFRTNHRHCFKFTFSPLRSSFSSESLNRYRLSLCQQCPGRSKHTNYSTFTPFLCSRRSNFSFLKPLFRKQRLHMSSPLITSNIKSGSKKRTFLGREMKKLLSLAKSEKWSLTGGILLLLISSTVTMAVPFALGKVIDLIYSTDADKMRDNLNKLTLTLLFVFIIGGACNFGRVYLMNMSAQRMTRMMREKVFNSIMKQEVAFFDKNKTGELINRLSADTSLVSQCVTMNISDGLRSTVMVAAGISMMFYMSAELAVVSLIIVPPIAGMAIIYGRFIRKITKQVQDSLAEATQFAEERISNVRTVKSFGKENIEMDHYKEHMERVLSLANREALARGVFFGMAGLSGNLVVLSVLYYGGVMVSGQGLSVGDLSAFLLYAAYIGISLGGLSSFYSELNRGVGASARLWDIIERTPSIKPTEKSLYPRHEAEGGVQFSDVNFSYLERDNVLKGLSLNIPSGKVTAVVGPSGSGKTTLASLILRLYDPNDGLLTLDGKPLSEYQPKWITDNVASVGQEPVLFSGTIKENILYGAVDPDSVTQEQLDCVMREANVTNFVKSLPQGLDTLVGERGVMLSGGQKQRVAIARALIKNPRILLLDEATSALDSESEHLVQEALERSMKGRTVLTIAHRLSTIKNSDQIAVLDEGKIVELGSYDDLMKKENGFFRKLIQHQMFQKS